MMIQYAPYFAGWPFFNAMERINDGVSTLDASIAKPLTTTTASYPGDGLIKREDSDHESDGSDVCFLSLSVRTPFFSEPSPF